MNPSRNIFPTHPLVLAVSAVLLLGLSIGVYLSSPPDFTDFEVYRIAGVKSLGHHTVYDVEGIFQFKYAPVTALFFAGLSGPFTATTARWIWWVVSLVTWLAIFYFSASFFLSHAPHRWRWLVPFACLALFLVALRSELKLGQANGLPFLLTLLALHGSEKGQRGQALAGFLWAVAVSFKLSFLMVGPLFLFRGRLATLAWFGIFITGVNLLPTGLYHGWDFAAREIRSWLGTLMVSTAEIMTQWHNTSLSGLLQKAGLPSMATKTIWGASLLGFLAWTWILRRGRIQTTASLFLVGMLIWNPLVWPYWILMAFPAALLIGDQAASRLKDDQTSTVKKVWIILGCVAAGAIIFQHDSHFSIRFGQMALKAAFIALLSHRLWVDLKTDTRQASHVRL